MAASPHSTPNRNSLPHDLPRFISITQDLDTHVEPLAPFDLRSFYLDTVGREGFASLETLAPPSTTSLLGTAYSNARYDAFIGLATLFGLTERSDAASLRELLKGLEVRAYMAGEHIMQPHSHAATAPSATKQQHHQQQLAHASEAAMLFIVTGMVEVALIHADRHGNEEPEAASTAPELTSIYLADAGDTVGHIAVLTGDYHYRVIALPNSSTPLASSGSFSRPSFRPSFFAQQQQQPPDVVVGRIPKSVFDKLVFINARIMTRTMSILIQQVSPFLRQVRPIGCLCSLHQVFLLIVVCA